MNWYKIALKQKNILQIAQEVRKDQVKTHDSESLREQCLGVSKALKKVLINNGYDAIVTRGLFRVDRPDQKAIQDWKGKKEDIERDALTLEHYWVEVNNLIVDLTSSQFNDLLNKPLPLMQMGTYSQLQRYIPITPDW